MLNKLSVTNGVKGNLDLDFHKGVTIIQGENGKGKSLVQEYIRFALFGTSALRGKASEYPKQMSVTLTFTINDNEHIIKRTLNDCYFDNTVVGTTACNKAIVKLLGYDLSIFDMGNCAKQFEITKLGEMKPTERKQAVDKLIGIDCIEKLEKKVKEKLQAVNGALSVIPDILREPQFPELGYVPELDMERELRLITQQEMMISEINKMKSQGVEKCDEPIKPNGTYEKAVLKKSLYDELKNIVVEEISDEYNSAEKIYDLISKRQAWDNFGEIPEEPSMTLEEISQEEKKWSDWNAWQNSKKATCPDCGKVFSLTGVEECEKPTYDLSYLRNQKELIQKLERMPKFEKPYETVSELNKKLSDLTKFLNYKSKKEELEKLEDETSVENWDTYNSDLIKYKKYLELENLVNVLLNSEHPALNRNLYNKYQQTILENKVKQENYERELSDYKTKIKIKETYEKQKKLYTETLEGLKRIKLRVKSTITPSLSRVASEISSDMTDGVVSKVEISESFEITVNGKSIGLLSGSEKAVANLAIRLALGRILTHKVLNIFIGDEIDASMDDERALLVSKSLHKLASQIDQVILISHKKVEGDYIITIR